MVLEEGDQGNAVFDRIFSIGLMEKITFEQILKVVRELAMQKSGGRTFQVKSVQRF